MILSHSAQPERGHRIIAGFTLLEVILAIMVTSILCIGLLRFFMSSLELYYYISERSEVVHQLLTGIEAVSSCIQNAKPSSIELMGATGEGTYEQIQFQQYASSELCWFYLNPEGKLIQAVKDPDEEWGRNSVAEGVDSLRFSQQGNDAGVPIICVEIQGRHGMHRIVIATHISPGFL